LVIRDVGHDHRGFGQHFRRSGVARRMRHITTTISGHHGTHDVEGALFWIFAGLIMVIAFGDAVAVLAAAVAIVTAVAWIYRTIEHRLQPNDTHTAPVTHLRPELGGQHDTNSAHALLHHPDAA
jgi:hypothetical protein